METRGVLAPETAGEARETYQELDSTAETVVRATAKSMEFDGDEYGERVTEGVVAAAHEALFASLLAVQVGSRAEFEAWCADHEGFEVVEEGAETVDSVAWHAAPAADVAVAATFQAEPDAAVSAARRIAFGRVYRDLVT
jgi:hypothetical protein